MVAGFEFGGLLGALFGGWITDRFLRGRAVRVCLVYMLLAGVSIFIFWKVTLQSEVLMAGILAAAGFFIYGPQCLLAVARRESGDQARRGDGDRSDFDLRLCEHGAFRLGPGRAGPGLWMERGVRRIDRRSGFRFATLRVGLECEGAWLRVIHCSSSLPAESRTTNRAAVAFISCAPTPVTVGLHCSPDSLLCTRANLH
jgi:hypothetical protein